MAILAADGLTNQAICDELFVSMGTVKNHLAGVFDKLGVRRRGDPVREVSRHDRASVELTR